MLIDMEPTATPTEKIRRNRVATTGLADKTSLASGGNSINRMAPIAQKKLMAMIAKNTLASSIVVRIRETVARIR